MKRLLIDKLLIWKSLESRKPLLLDGARQVGKSYLIEKNFGRTFQNLYKFDFLENPQLKIIFKDSLKPKDIISSLELEIGKKIQLDQDLIFFDEIGECQLAVNSLKYFCEEMPNIFLCASGSNIGLLDSFPVGKTYNLELFPMTFYEFLLASGEELLIEEFEKQGRLMKTHEMLWEKLLDYYYVGGMPEAVSSWFNESSIIDKIEKVGQIHKDLMIGYKRDFGKYGGKVNSLHIESIFSQVPMALQMNRDDSVKRFSFKEIIKGKNRYNELRGPIDWLEKSKLVSKNFLVTSIPEIPLIGKTKENIFKLFFFDLGLLCYSLGLTYQEIIGQNFPSKGFIAENFVQNELLAAENYPLFSWREGMSEIEFLLKTKSGDIYPLEVKSGKRTKAKSLGVYIKKYKPKINVKLIGARGSESSVNGEYRWPLYYVQYLLDL